MIKCNSHFESFKYFSHRIFNFLAIFSIIFSHQMMVNCIWPWTGGVWDCPQNWFTTFLRNFLVQWKPFSSIFCWFHSSWASWEQHSTWWRMQPCWATLTSVSCLWRYVPDESFCSKRGLKMWGCSEPRTVCRICQIRRVNFQLFPMKKI